MSGLYRDTNNFKRLNCVYLSPIIHSSVKRRPGTNKHDANLNTFNPGTGILIVEYMPPTPDPED